MLLGRNYCEENSFKMEIVNQIFQKSKYTISSVLFHIIFHITSRFFFSPIPKPFSLPPHFTRPDLILSNLFSQHSCLLFCSPFSILVQLPLDSLPLPINPPSLSLSLTRLARLGGSHHFGVFELLGGPGGEGDLEVYLGVFFFLSKNFTLFFCVFDIIIYPEK